MGQLLNQHSGKWMDFPDKHIKSLRAIGRADEDNSKLNGEDHEESETSTAPQVVHATQNVPTVEKVVAQPPKTVGK